jgi:hypothetical protein
MENTKDNKEGFSDFTLENILNPEPILQPDPDQVEDTKTDIVVDKTDDEPDDSKVDVTDDEPTDEPTDNDDASLVPLVELLNKDLGIEDFNTEEFQDSVEGLTGYIKEIVTGTVQYELDQIKSAGDGLVGQLYDFLANGGEVKTFKELFLESPDYLSISIEGDDNIANQKLVVEEYLKSQEYDEEERKAKIEKYEAGGLLEDEAKSAVKRLAKQQEVEKQKTLKAQEQANIERNNEIKQYWDNIQNTVKNAKDISGLPISDNKKQEFLDYIMKRDKDGMTAYERKLRKDPLANIKAAYADFMNYEFADLKRSVKTEVVKDLKKNLSRFTDKNANSSKSTTPDLDTNDKTNFKAFKLPIH